MRHTRDPDELLEVPRDELRTVVGDDPRPRFGVFLLCSLQNDFDLGLGHRLAQIPVHQSPAEAIQHACVWSSLTPFVPPRFFKERGANTLEGQVQAELASRGLPRAEEVTVLRGSAEVAALRHFVRRRQRGGGSPPVDIGYALSLRFATPVCGMISLGYAAHFGLGLFASEAPEGE